MKIKQFISLALLTLAPLAFSQDRAGNGGDAIICNENGKTSVEVKDYWEYSQMINNLKIDLGPGISYTEKVEYALNRLSKVDSVRAEKLMERFRDSTFLAFVSRGQIPVVDDSPSYLKVDGDKYCNEVQVAFQILHPKQFQSKVLIDKTIFMQFDEVNKAGLILHELIYEQDIKLNNAKDSDTIRWFNYVISSNILKVFDDVKNGKSQKYADLISDRKIDYFGYDSVPDLRPKEQGKESAQSTTKKEEQKTIPLLLPSNFSIVKSDVIQEGRNTTVESMIIDIEDDSLQLGKFKVDIIQKKNVSYELEKEFQKISGEFLYRSNNQDWKVSSIQTTKGREYSLKLEESHVDILNMTAEGDMAYSISTLDQFSLSGITKLSINNVAMECKDKCLVSWDNTKIPSLKGMFLFEGRELQFLDSKVNKMALSLVKPIEYKVKTKKASKSQYIQRTELSQEGLFGFIMIRKDESQVDMMGRSYNLEKCGKDSCSYKINLTNFSLQRI